MSFTNYVFDNFVSHELSKLTECNAPSIEGSYPQAQHWINNFILSNVFRKGLSSEVLPFAFAFLRRTQSVVIEYQLGREALVEFISGPRERLSLYFSALGHFETMVAYLYQAFDFGHKLINKNLFEKDDGSPLQRLNRINNINKHLELSSIPESQIQHFWITNNGLSVRDASLAFDELINLIDDICSIADKLSTLERHTNEDAS
jgi:hypothetical protein